LGLLGSALLEFAAQLLLALLLQLQEGLVVAPGVALGAPEGLLFLVVVVEADGGVLAGGAVLHLSGLPGLHEALPLGVHLLDGLDAGLHGALRDGAAFDVDLDHLVDDVLLPPRRERRDGPQVAHGDCCPGNNFVDEQLDLLPVLAPAALPDHHLDDLGQPVQRLPDIGAQVQHVQPVRQVGPAAEVEGVHHLLLGEALVEVALEQLGLPVRVEAAAGGLVPVEGCQRLVLGELLDDAVDLRPAEALGGPEAVLTVAEDVPVLVVAAEIALSVEDLSGAHGDRLPLAVLLHVLHQLLVRVAGDFVGVPLVRLDLV